MLMLSAQIACSLTDARKRPLLADPCRLYPTVAGPIRFGAAARSRRSLARHEDAAQLRNDVLLESIVELFKLMKMGRRTPVGMKNIKSKWLRIVRLDVRANVTVGHEVKLT